MKKKLLLTAGILTGVVLFFGVKRQLAPVSVGEAKPPLRQAAKVAVETVKDEQAEAQAETLDSKIEKLRAWTERRDSKLGRGAALQILEEWSKHDAKAALDFVSAAPFFPGRNTAYAVPLSRISRTDPKAVVEWLSREIGQINERTEVVEGIVWRNLTAAPAAALAITETPEVVIDGNLFGRLLGEVAKTQMQLALQGLAQKSSEIQSRALGPMLETLAQSNPRDALNWYLSRGVEDSDAAKALAMGCVKSGQYNIPDLAARLNLNTEQTDRMLHRLTWDGVVLDPKSLAAFSDRARLRAAEVAARNLEDSPDRVLAFVKATVGPEQQLEVLAHGWRKWLGSDRKGAQAWLQQLPDRRLASELPARLEREEQLSNPHKALELARTIVNQQERKDVVESAVQRLVWQDPVEAATWLAQNPGMVSMNGRIGNLAERYLEKDDAGAMAWIARLSAGEERDEALGAAAIYWARKEIDFATVSMSTIGDAQKRQRCMFDLYLNLNRVNATKADQWLAAQGLSAEVRQSWKALGQSSSGRYFD